MSEIKKMYKNANITPDCTYLFLVDGNGENEAARTISIGSRADLKRLIVDCGVKGRVIKSINTLKPFYPPFTAKKQLEIVKQVLFSTWWMNLKRLQFAEEFDEGLAQMINELWQDLSEEEKQQVRGILE